MSPGTCSLACWTEPLIHPTSHAFKTKSLDSPSFSAQATCKRIPAPSRQPLPQQEHFWNLGTPASQYPWPGDLCFAGLLCPGVQTPGRELALKQGVMEESTNQEGTPACSCPSTFTACSGLPLEYTHSASTADCWPCKFPSCEGGLAAGRPGSPSSLRCSSETLDKPLSDLPSPSLT